MIINCFYLIYIIINLTMYWILSYTRIIKVNLKWIPPTEIISMLIIFSYMHYNFNTQGGKNVTMFCLVKFIVSISLGYLVQWKDNKQNLEIIKV